ncbi:hypothetical protein SDRG_00936 [Saprolegnia diclina VS20]|uniref:DUF218 domain-containing protein n=1 Tax=Saprolegnia diclina (strain VS20) TaxID=1156394 RepID=T0R6L2_SAPDV|nr:hypothetical protein SDRG_00936 [Saprolegnia diclina VS20]EQC42095.1 hypothetical protein SDRG_00936 [Saprolegnia diclina VS20]|eukprot:XP_008604664.1 hypothetical protein SDRG_00936 [Saprolegnia diclina VS20]
MRPRKVSGLRQDSGRLLVTGAHQRSSEQTKLLAAVGLDLFRSGLRVDGAGTKASHVEPRHPAISPNLDTIPEGERIEPSHLQQAQAIVVLGGPLGRANLPGPWLSQRIETALPLYHSIVQQEGSTCYVVPFGGDGSEEGALECEVARNHLVQRGVSPHHVLLDCNAANTIENILTLLPLLTHLRVGIVRVITSSFHMPRMQLYFDSLLHRCRAASFEIYYHPTHRDHVTLLQQRDLEAKEMALMTSTRRQLDEAMQCVHAQTAPAQQYLPFLHQATRPPPSAATYDERTKAPPTSFYGYSHR